MAKFTLYGNNLSQPSRAVYWLLKEGKVDFDYKQLDLSKGEHKTPEILAIHPGGQVPCATDGDVKLFESTAVMQYICNKFGLDTWYPKDPAARAKVDIYLAYHNTLRKAVVFQFHTFFAPVFGMTPDEGKRMEGKAMAETSLQFIETNFFPTGKFVTGDVPTIADLQLFNEILLYNRSADFDMKPYPKILNFQAEMEKLPFYGETCEMINGLIPKLA